MSMSTSMMTMHFRAALAGLAAAGFAWAGPAAAGALNYTATLTCQNEVPPHPCKASGVINATYDTTTKMLTWHGTYKNLSGPPIAAHFHGPAGPGKNAPVLVPAPVKASPFEGSATLTEAQARDLADGKVYFNIHTQKFKGGEIRGQLAAATRS
jgi:hypothetical protein